MIRVIDIEGFARLQPPQLADLGLALDVQPYDDQLETKVNPKEHTADVTLYFNK